MPSDKKRQGLGRATDLRAREDKPEPANRQQLCGEFRARRSVWKICATIWLRVIRPQLRSESVENLNSRRSETDQTNGAAGEMKLFSREESKISKLGGKPARVRST